MGERMCVLFTTPLPVLEIMVVAGQLKLKAHPKDHFEII